jgi:hypothetical protein
MKRRWMTMNNEDNKIILQNVNNEAESCNNIGARKILLLRLRKYKPILIKAFPFLVVGFICFAAGVGISRNLTKHRADRVFSRSPSIQRNMPDSQSGATQDKGTFRSPQRGKIQ